MEKNFAIFDVDHTLITRDSMFLFLWFSIKKNPIAVLRIFPVLWYTLLYQLKIVKVCDAKRQYFYLIKNMNESDLEAFYDRYICRFLCHGVLTELIEKKEQGYTILLVSASPHAYLKYFEIKMPQVDKVIATELHVGTDGKYMNTIKGENCSGDEKVRRIHQYLEESEASIHYDNTYIYSDSRSDHPMFQLGRYKKKINKRDRTIGEYKE